MKNRTERDHKRTACVSPKPVRLSSDDLPPEWEWIALLARHARVIAWRYDEAADRLIYYRPKEKEFAEIRGLRRSADARAWRFLWDGGAPSGVVHAHALFWREERPYRLTYRRADGETAGFAEEPDEESEPGLCSMEALRARMGEEMALLRPGEKGVLFAAEIDRLSESRARGGDTAMRLMAQTLRAEFSDGVCGRCRGRRFLVFFRGALAIDVVERRAQRFVDEFRRRALGASLADTCSVGIAVACGARPAVERLIASAERTLDEALLRGANHYRMAEIARY